MPPGGDGYYYFFVNFRVGGGTTCGFDIEINEEVLCTALSGLSASTTSDSEAASCSGVIGVIEGIYHPLFTFCEHTLLYVVLL